MKKRKSNRMISLLCSAVIVLSAVFGSYETAQAEAFAPFFAGGALTLGEMAYGILIGSGCSVVGADLVNDSLFQEKYSIDYLVNNGYLVPVEGGDSSDLNDYDWSGVFTQINNDISSGASGFAKNILKPMFDQTDGWQSNLQDWWTDIGMSGYLSSTMANGLDTVSEWYQEWAKPLIDFCMTYTTPDYIFDSVSDFSIQFPNYRFCGFKNNRGYTEWFRAPDDCFCILTNSSLIFFNTYNFQSYYYTTWNPSWVSTHTSNALDYGGSSELFFSSQSCDNSYNFFGYNLYFDGSFQDAILWYSNNYSNLSLNNVSPSLLGKTGYLDNTDDISPVIEGNQEMDIPRNDVIADYINKAVNPEEDDDPKDNYINLVTPLIRPSDNPDPDPTIVPDPDPGTDPEPSVSPEPTFSPGETDPTVVPPNPDDPEPSGTPDNPDPTGSPDDPDPTGSPDDPGSEELLKEDYLAEGLRNFFPFCIPWDLAAIFTNFTADRRAPCFTFPLKIDRFGIDETITVDLSVFDEAAALLRTLELILFVVLLAVASRKLIGAL